MTRGASGYLYAVGVDWSGPIKIGVAVNVERRLERLQAGNHLPLTLLWQAGPFNDPFALEAQLHNAFAPHRVRGEWFVIPEISIEALTAAVSGAAAAVRLFPEPDAESKAARAACAFLIERLRRTGLSTEDAMGSLASSTGMGRSTIWALRYRPPTQIMTMPYATIVAELWRVAGKPEFGSADIPDAKTVMALIDTAEAELGIAPSRTGTEG